MFGPPSLEVGEPRSSAALGPQPLSHHQVQCRRAIYDATFFGVFRILDAVELFCLLTFPGALFKLMSDE